MDPDDVLGIGEPGVEQNVFGAVPRFDCYFQHIQHDIGGFAERLFPTFGCQGSLVELFCDADQIMRF